MRFEDAKMMDNLKQIIPDFSENDYTISEVLKKVCFQAIPSYNYRWLSIESTEIRGKAGICSIDGNWSHK